jgi:hypothetical protein
MYGRRLETPPSRSSPQLPLLHLRPLYLPSGTPIQPSNNGHFGYSPQPPGAHLTSLSITFHNPPLQLLGPASYPNKKATAKKMVEVAREATEECVCEREAELLGEFEPQVKTTNRKTVVSVTSS